MGFTVAIVGPDGAGKTTVCRELAATLACPVQYVYMGINLEVSNVLLPTTRLWLELKRWRGKRPDMGQSRRMNGRPSEGVARRLASQCKSGVRMINLMCEELFRQSLCQYWQLRGRIVLCDRDFYCDYYAYDVAPQGNDRRWIQRLHGWFLRHAYRRPDLLIVLEAPAEHLYQRKREGTLESLEQRRVEYRELKSQFCHFHVVDATQPLDAVVQQVGAIIEDSSIANPPLAGEPGL